ncbi:4-hydroxybenzoate CoA ligase [Burkholderiales bacterium]|nr:4-hydroxybenzoate CoA ligase [Burkholderiales bacterium]
MNAAQNLLETGRDAASAITSAEGDISYSGLRDAVARAGAAWKAMGIAAGDRVIVFAPDSIDWVVAYLGAIWAGGVAVGINSRLPMAELGPILVESEAAAIWCEGAQAAAICGAAVTMSKPPRIVVATSEHETGWLGRLEQAQPMPAVARDPEDPALWIGTSGTTGRPKATVHAQRVVLHAHAFAQGVLGLTEQDRLYASSKLFFAYALGNSLFAGLRAGATVILDRDWPTPQRVGEMVARFGPTVLFSVPTLYHKMLHAGVAAAIGASGVRRFVSAGEALPPVVRQGWQQATGQAIISGYGTSETLCLMLYCDCDDGRFAATPMTQIRWPEGDDASTPRRIWIRSPTVALGYWCRPQAQTDGFSDGWFSPGDVFVRHADGRLEFTGRNDDMIKIAGQWVSTVWVEQALAAACGDSLQQIAAVSVTTADGLAALSVLGVAEPACAELARQRMAEGIDRLPKHRRPRWVHWLDALPMTPTGKVQRRCLRELHQAAIEDMRAEVLGRSAAKQDA